MIRSVVARMILVVGGLFCPLSSMSALAQDDCAPIIQSLAETVLAGRDGLPPLQARRFGTRAIYLLSRYGDLGDDEIDRLLSEAVEARMHGAADLETAWQVHRGTADLSPETITAMVDTAKPSAMRALLLTGEAEAVMATIAALPAGNRAALSQLAVTISFDQSDAVKAELGAIAAGQGLDWLAAGFAAAQEDPKAWPNHVEGMSTEDVDNLLTLWGWMPAFNGNPILARSTDLQDAEAQSWRQATGLVTWASAKQPEIALLNTFLNQTGAYSQAAAVAKSVLKRFDTALSPTGPLDAGWLATLEAFDTQGFDADAIRSQFGSITFGINRVGRENVGDILDWIVAIDALRPYLQDEGELPANPPELLSSEFSDWDRWLALAGAVHENAALAIKDPSPDDLPILAEMLHAAGSRELLVQMLQAGAPAPESIALADDFAARIDRLCDAHLWHKGEAPLLAGQALYKFDRGKTKAIGED